jgi:branched-chain amino acid transport system substrate-binding protein
VKQRFSVLYRAAVCMVAGAGLLSASVSAQSPNSAARTQAGKNEQFIPVLSYRVGPYAEAGKGIFGGYIDYFDMINRRDGGINGVKLTWEECETEYKVDLGVACYEKLKKKGPTGATVVAPYSTGITYALIERVTADKIPLVSMGYGRADASDGRVFPYVFPIVTNYWSQSTAKIMFIARFSGGVQRLAGKKIVNLYHGSAYGKETMAILDLQAKKYGFTVTHIEVPHPGTEQQTQWDQIKRIAPDWVILRGWGVMNPTALIAANKAGFPASRILGVWWSGAEEDVKPAGEAANGFVTAAFHLSGADFPVVKDIVKHVYGGGRTGAMDDPARIGTIYYNRGVIEAMITVEAIRTAQGRYGNRPLTGEEVRWGLENLNLTDSRLNRLGAFTFMQSLKLSCSDHEGGGAVKFQKWRGNEWVPMSGWIASDQSMVRPLIEESAAKYAKEKGIVPRDCASER